MLGQKSYPSSWNRVACFAVRMIYLVTLLPCSLQACNTAACGYDGAADHPVDDDETPRGGDCNHGFGIRLKTMSVAHNGLSPSPGLSLFLPSPSDPQPGL